MSASRLRTSTGLLLLGMTLLLTRTAGAASPPILQDQSATLARYVAKPDGSYAWHEVSSGRIRSVDYVETILTSQVWRGIAWKHQLIVFRPARLESSPAQGFLFIHGGRWRDELEKGWNAALPKEARLFAKLAESLGAPLGVLRHVPYQPMFERTEDALIAYTFEHYLESGENDWPLLLPMVKSAVRGMDAMQELAYARWGDRLTAFTVSGASKRGWTSWLTAAVDRRVTSVAPMVIDMLNLPEQIELQRATFGGLSEEVRDYDEIGLPERIDSERGQRLLSIVDPYSYRSRLTQPKLILLGTNDRYWPLDALKLYWNELPDPKYVLYVPNQGHGMNDYGRLIGSLSALHRHSARGEALPRLSWKFGSEREGLSIVVRSDRPPHGVTSWRASSPTRDFRDAKWVPGRCKRSADGHVCRWPRAVQGFTAMYAEADFRERGETPYSLSTTVCIAAAADPQPREC